MNKNKESKNLLSMDERQIQIVQKACANGFVFLILYLIAIIVYKVVKGGDPIWEIIGVLVAAFIVIVSRRLMGDVEQPLDYLNRPLPTGNSKSEKLKRFKSYLIDSILFGLGFAVMDVGVFLLGGDDFLEHEMVKKIFSKMSGLSAIVLSAVVVFCTAAVISLILEYLIGEYYNVRRYNKMIAELDKEEKS
ncbi:MAG: hypothetical protein ACOX1F_00415 [Erysipelotrichaceae bacterium]